MAKLDKNQRKVQVQVDPQGRIVIPAHIRRTLDIFPGRILIARVGDGRLVLEKLDQILARLQDTFSQVPGDVILVDELIAKRREEARRESKA